MSGSVATEHLMSGSVATDHLMSGSVVTDHLMSGSVATDHLMSGSVVTDHVMSGSVVTDHLMSVSAPQQGEPLARGRPRSSWLGGASPLLSAGRASPARSGALLVAGSAPLLPNSRSP
jgi:hypothetical protein